MTIILKNKVTLLFDDFIFKCSIGKNGLAKSKVEGDKKTPIGTFTLGNLLYRNDRYSRPLTKLKCFPIKKNMGWCDDIKSKRYYNKLIKVKKNLRYEKLYRRDRKYDLIIPINYNTRMNYNTTTRINNDLIRDIMNDLINETIVASEKNKHIISPIWKEREKENN